MERFLETLNKIAAELEKEISGKTPYQQGYDAGRDGQSIWGCPYSSIHHRRDHDSYMRGHADGYRDRMLRGIGYEEYIL